MSLVVSTSNVRIVMLLKCYGKYNFPKNVKNHTVFVICIKYVCLAKWQTPSLLS